MKKDMTQKESIKRWEMSQRLILLKMDVRDFEGHCLHDFRQACDNAQSLLEMAHDIDVPTRTIELALKKAEKERKAYYEKLLQRRDHPGGRLSTVSA